jgi:segregation and condensation protein B
VEVIGPIETLTQRKLITVVGRRETIGRPILYGTTSEFLRQFGLNSLDDLPKLDSFNIENVAAAAQSTAVELIEQDSAEPVAEGAPPQDPAQAAAEAPAGEAAPEASSGPAVSPGAVPEPGAQEATAEAPAEEAVAAELPADPAPEEPRPEN